MAKAANVILVHGAWADGSCWSKVIPLLGSRAAGERRATSTDILRQRCGHP
jgi:hypothetical protein